MPISIIALAPKDGWAFISRDGRIYLIRPPYDQDDEIEVSIDEVAQRFDSCEFREVHASFENEDDLIDFIKKAFIELRKNQNSFTPSSDQLIELLNYSTNEALSQLLGKIRNEMIRSGRYLDAINIVDMLLKIDNIEQRDDIYREIIGLKDQVYVLECQKMAQSIK